MRRPIALLLCALLIVGVLAPTSIASAQASSGAASPERDLIIHQPPKGWNPLTATDEQLQYYFYPPRPKDLEKLGEWERAVSGEWVAPTFEPVDRHTTIRPGRKTGPSTNIQAGTNIDDPAYSGITEYKSGTTRVVGWWTMPWAYAPESEQPAYSSAWIGLGDPSSALVQMGTESDIQVGGGGTYFTWWEMVGTSPSYSYAQKISAVPAQPGDSMYGDITLTINPDNTATASFYLNDQTAGKVTSFSKTLTGYAHVTDAANWIVERPTVAGQIRNLANFGTVTFKAKYGSASSLVYPSDADPDTDYTRMVGSVVLATTGRLNATGDFTITWKAYY